MPQQWPDDVCFVQPSQFVTIDQHILGPVAQSFVHESAMAATAPGQQAQDVVTMATALWQMMSSMVQRHLHRCITHR